METKFTEQESLAVISQMIEQARNNFQKGSGNTMVYYGLLVAAIAILNAILILVFERININYVRYSFWIWSLMIPGSFIGYLIRRKVIRESMVKTHIDSIIRSTWNGYGFSVYIFLFVIFTIAFGKRFYEVLFLITPVMLILTGIAEFITAKACRFKPYSYGAIIMWLGAIICAIAVVLWIWEPTIIQFFILAICMIFGFLIPGLKLNKLAKENV